MTLIEQEIERIDRNWHSGTWDFEYCLLKVLFLIVRILAGKTNHEQ